jgi:hypothetical protein
MEAAIRISTGADGSTTVPGRAQGQGDGVRQREGADLPQERPEARREQEQPHHEQDVVEAQRQHMKEARLDVVRQDLPRALRDALDRDGLA